MTYQLKGGEEIRNGKLFGWTGKPCIICKGDGLSHDGVWPCGRCAGTGEYWGLMPKQPADLPLSDGQGARKE